MEAINIRSNIKYYYVLGAQLAKANRDMQEASRFYQLMTENTTDYKPYLVELATSFQATGKQKDAIIAFESTENLTLDQSMKLVEMYVQESKKRKATELMERLIIQHPSDSDLKYQYANLLNTLGETELAIASLEAEPNKTAEMRILLSNLYEGKGESSAKYDLLIESFGDPEASLTEKTLLLGQLILENSTDLPIDLIDSLQTSLENQYPNEALAVENGTYVYTKLAEIASGNQRDLFQVKAINRYKQLKELKPGDFKVWDKVLSYEYNTGDWQALSADADEALMLYPNQAIFYIYLASAKINLNEPDEAEDLLNQASRMTRSNELLTSQILGKRAEIAEMNNQIQQASQLYQQALKLNQIHPETSISYGKFMATHNVITESTETISNRFTVGEKDLKDVYQRALALYSSDKPAEALVLLLSNIHTFEDNKNGAAMELYGDIYKQLKLTDIALKYWVKAKEFGGASDKIDQKIASEKND
jgi:predicted Zn-dependent protease